MANDSKTLKFLVNCVLIRDRSIKLNENHCVPTICVVLYFDNLFLVKINFSRGVGGSLSYFVEFLEGWGSSVPYKSGKFREIPSVVRHGYFLEPLNMLKLQSEICIITIRNYTPFRANVRIQVNVYRKPTNEYRKPTHSDKES